MDPISALRGVIEQYVNGEVALVDFYGRVALLDAAVPACDGVPGWSDFIGEVWELLNASYTEGVPEIDLRAGLKALQAATQPRFSIAIGEPLQMAETRVAGWVTLHESHRAVFPQTEVPQTPRLLVGAAG